MVKDIFLDLENSAFLPEDVLNAIMPYFNQKGYGHPGLTHRVGWEAYEAIQGVLKTLATHLRLDNPEGLHLCHDEVEANNLLISGAPFHKKEKPNFVLSPIAPLSIIYTARKLRNQGVEIRQLEVDEEGFVQAESLKTLVDDQTVLVSVDYVNHEVGTVQDLKSLIAIAKGKNPKVLFHSDMSDAWGKISFSLKEIPVDMAVFSSTKLLGPRGVALFYLRPGLRWKPLYEGPYATEPLQPGLENVPAMVGFAKAVALHLGDPQRIEKLKQLRDRLRDELLALPDTLLNGPEEPRGADNLSISFLGCEGEALTVACSDEGVFLSSGSACSRKMLEPSHVLLSLGYPYERAHGSLLMKVHRFLTEEDIDRTVEVLKKAVNKIRKISGRGMTIP